MARVDDDSIFVTVIEKLAWLIIALTIVSTVFLAFSPLLPTSTEYEGSFPDKFWENLRKLPTTVLRHLVLFNEYYNIEWILYFLSHIFFLLLLLNIKRAISKPLKPKELIDHYFNWAVGSLLITIVFIAKYISVANITQISLGILGLTASIFILLYYTTKIKKDERTKEKEGQKQR